MYRILIADDEKIIREGIGESFEKTGLYRVSYADNGRDALKLCECVDFDAMLIDVVMPGMNGLELLKKLAERDNDAVKIILSAHDDFEFVREAMANKAMDYLLKPFYPHDVAYLIDKLGTALQKRRERQEEYQRLIKTVEESKDIIRKRFFEDMLNGWVDEADFQRWKDLLGDDFQNRRYCVMFLKIVLGHSHRHLNPSEYQAWLISASNIVEQVIDEYSECLFYKEHSGTFIFLFSVSSEERFEALAEKLFSEIRTSLADSGVTLCGGMGGLVNDIAEVKFSYREAHTALKYNVSFHHQSVLSIGDIQPTGVKFRHLLDEEAFISDLKLGNKEAVNGYFDELVAMLKQRDKDLSFMELALIKILATAKMVLLEVDPEGYKHINNQYYDVMFELRNMLSFEEKVTKVMHVVTHIADMIESKRDDHNSKLVERVKKYIMARYNEDIQLNSIAESVCLSKNYVSQLFKQKMGMSIIEYVHRIRITKAKELMENTDQKIYEISDAVGYSDQHYFSSVFKRFTGLSPSEYKELF